MKLKKKHLLPLCSGYVITFLDLVIIMKRIGMSESDTTENYLLLTATLQFCNSQFSICISSRWHLDQVDQSLNLQSTGIQIYKLTISSNLGNCLQSTSTPHSAPDTDPLQTHFSPSSTLCCSRDSTQTIL